MFEPIAKVVDILHLTANLNPQRGNPQVGAVASAQGIDIPQLNFPESTPLTPSDQFPESSQMPRLMKVVAYLKASQDNADVVKQRQTILDFAQNQRLSISRFIESPIALVSEKHPNKRHRLFHHIEPEDTLIVSQLSDIGWSLNEIVKSVDMLVRKRVRFVAIKEGMTLNGKPGIESQVIASVFGVLAEIGHQLVSKRTKEALAIAKRRGRIGGRRPALNRQQQQFAVRFYQEGEHTVSEICQMLGISKPTLYNYLKKADVSLRSHHSNRV